MYLSESVKVGVGIALFAVLLLAGAGFAAAQTVNVGTNPDFKPFEFKDPETGAYVGFDMDMIDVIMDRIGADYELHVMNFDGLIPALTTGQLDVAIAAITITEERDKRVDFSDPYYDAGLVVLVREGETEIKGVDDLNGEVVATKSGTTSVNYIDANLEPSRLSIYPTIDSAFLALINGNVNAVLFDSPTVLDFANDRGQGRVKVVGDLLDAQQYGLAFTEGSELIDDVNRALAEMKADGTYARLYEKWFGEAPK